MIYGEGEQLHPVAVRAKLAWKINQRIIAQSRVVFSYTLVIPVLHNVVIKLMGRKVNVLCIFHGFVKIWNCSSQVLVLNVETCHDHYLLWQNSLQTMDDKSLVFLMGSGGGGGKMGLIEIPESRATAISVCFHMVSYGLLVKSSWAEFKYDSVSSLGVGRSELWLLKVQKTRSSIFLIVKLVIYAVDSAIRAVQPYGRLVGVRSSPVWNAGGPASIRWGGRRGTVPLHPRAESSVSSLAVQGSGESNEKRERLVEILVKLLQNANDHLRS